MRFCGALLLALALAPAARAQLPEGQHIELVKRNAMPGNGALLLVIENLPGINVVVTGPDGERVEGNLERVRWYHWAFRPSETLLPGEYLIETTDGPPLHARNGLLSERFEVVEAMDLSPPELSAMPELRVQRLPEAGQCCELWTDAGVELGSCTPSVIYKTATVFPTLSSDAAPEVLDQFVFSVVADAPGATHDNPYLWNMFEWTVPAVPEGQEACFTIEAISIVDSSVHTYPELDKCVVLGSVSLDAEPATDPEAFFDRRHCTLPPEGLDAGWCQQNASCADDRDDPSCIAFNQVCEGGPAVEPPMGPAEPEPLRDAGMIDMPDDPPPPTTPGDEPEPPSPAERGCGCRTLAPSPPRASALLCAVLLAAALLRRRAR